MPASGHDIIERTAEVPLTDGRRQRVLYAAAPQPRAILIMFPGGAGDIGLDESGTIRHGDNFVVRTRALWVKHGYAVVIPDTIDGANLRGSRSSPQYAALARDLVAFAHRQAPAPVFLLGTSQGAIAALNGAAHAAPGAISGVILTESVSRLGGSGETVFSAGPETVRVPALVVANRDDRCDVAPPEDAPRIAAAMTASPDVHVAEISGGTARSTRTCGSLTPHGYFGIETAVVDMIAAWIDRHR
ncbi:MULTISPECIES: alpha/beta hydrolase [unclassified Bradyrhizobium]|uniref:alpha/beta hydrolase n=1 Tax=unclassified Bradyrhizobium TaxID=2631580 RepID=UPI0020122E2B|nr:MULTISPECIES: alpha/beta hydrolase [unclassified Bradyrhizobium]